MHGSSSLSRGKETWSRLRKKPTTTPQVQKSRAFPGGEEEMEAKKSDKSFRKATSGRLGSIRALGGGKGRSRSPRVWVENRADLHEDPGERT